MKIVRSLSETPQLCIEIYYKITKIIQINHFKGILSKLIKKQTITM